jgi:hypothetical protein
LRKKVEHHHNYGKKKRKYPYNDNGNSGSTESVVDWTDTRRNRERVGRITVKIADAEVVTVKIDSDVKL